MPASAVPAFPPDRPAARRAEGALAPAGVSDAADAAWLEALRAGDHDAVERLRSGLRDRLGPALRRSARGRSLGEADLEDLTQEASVRVLSKLDSFRGDSRFMTWAMAVALRVGFTALRRRSGPGRLPGESLDEAAVEARGADGARPESSAERRELMAALRAAMTEALTDRQREVMLLELAGTPRRQIADRFATTPGAIHKMMHDARRKLRQALLAAGFDASDLVGHSSLAGERP